MDSKWLEHKACELYGDDRRSIPIVDSLQVKSSQGQGKQREEKFVCETRTTPQSGVVSDFTAHRKRHVTYPTVSAVSANILTCTKRCSAILERQYRTTRSSNGKSSSTVKSSNRSESSSSPSGAPSPPSIMMFLL